MIKSITSLDPKGWETTNCIVREDGDIGLMQSSCDHTETSVIILTKDMQKRLLKVLIKVDK